MKTSLKIGDIVYSSLGVGVITNCYSGLLGDSEIAYSVNYFNHGNKLNRMKDFDRYY